MARWKPELCALIAAAAVVATVLLTASVTVRVEGDMLVRSRATYSALSSYADTGGVIHEYGVSSKDRHTFTTVFNRTPRRFLLDFHKDSGDRHVVWGDPDAFHTWSKTTNGQADYPNPNNVGAITLSGPSTAAAAIKIPTLLYPKAEIPGDFSNLKDIAGDGSDMVDGHRCERLFATARDVYGGTGREVNVRKMTIWIDSESTLIRKVVEEWKPLPGQVNRVTTTFEPQANPVLGESRFKFIASAK
jgi:hypothetical protein